MSTLIRLRKGLNIRLAGKAEKILLPEVPVTRFGVRFADFRGLLPVLKYRREIKSCAAVCCFMTSHFLR